MTRGRLLAEMDSEEITGWMAYDRTKEPSPEDHRHAGLCFLISRVAGNKKAKYEDFLPNRSGVRRKQSPAEVRARFAAVGAMNAAREKAAAGARAVGKVPSALGGPAMTPVTTPTMAHVPPTSGGEGG